MSNLNIITVAYIIFVVPGSFLMATQGAPIMGWTNAIIVGVNLGMLILRVLRHGWRK